MRRIGNSVRDTTGGKRPMVVSSEPEHCEDKVGAAVP